MGSLVPLVQLVLPSVPGLGRLVPSPLASSLLARACCASQGCCEWCLTSEAQSGLWPSGDHSVRPTTGLATGLATTTPHTATMINLSILVRRTECCKAGWEQATLEGFNTRQNKTKPAVNETSCTRSASARLVDQSKSAVGDIEPVVDGAHLANLINKLVSCCLFKLVSFFLFKLVSFFLFVGAVIAYHVSSK